MWSYNAVDPVKLIDGVWLPRVVELRWWEYPPVEGEQLAAEPYLVERYELLDHKINTVDAKLFELAFPPRTLVSDARAPQSPI